jgi:hypothetical protein
MKTKDLRIRTKTRTKTRIKTKAKAKTETKYAIVVEVFWPPVDLPPHFRFNRGPFLRRRSSDG